MIRQAIGWSAAITAAATCWAGVPWGIGTALALRALMAPAELSCRLDEPHAALPGVSPEPHRNERRPT